MVISGGYALGAALRHVASLLVGTLSTINADSIILPGVPGWTAGDAIRREIDQTPMGMNPNETDPSKPVKEQSTNDRGLLFLNENKQNPDVHVTSTGLHIRVLKTGDGLHQPDPMSGHCLVHVEGWLIDGTKLDSSIDRGEPFEMTPAQTIEGLNEAMSMMVEGDKWEVVVPAELAYGSEGTQPNEEGKSTIGPGEVIKFHVKLIQIKTGGRVRANCNHLTYARCSEREKDFLVWVKGLSVDDAKAELNQLEKNQDGTKWRSERIEMLQSIIGRHLQTPTHKARGLLFEDMDGDTKEVGGPVTIQRAANEENMQWYNLHWGADADNKLVLRSKIKRIEKTGQDLSFYIPKNTKIPNGVSHLMVFTENSSGEMAKGISIRLVDGMKPCATGTETSCDCSITVSDDSDPDPQEAKVTISLKPAPGDITEYAVYWGQSGCQNQMGAKNGHLVTIPTKSAKNQRLKHHVDDDTEVPDDTTHLLVFPKNKFGESKFCRSVKFTDYDMKKANAKKAVETDDEL